MKRNLTAVALLLSAIVTAASIAASCSTSGSNGGQTAPVAPTGLAAEPGNRHVVLRWDTPPGDRANGYNVYRSRTPGSGYEKVARFTGRRAIVLNLENEQGYYFVVTAVNDAGESARSPEVKVTPASSGPSHQLLIAGPNPVDPAVADVRSNIEAAIQTAAESVQLTIYELDDPDSAGIMGVDTALCNAAESKSQGGQGPSVQVLHNWCSFSDGEQSTYGTVLDALGSCGATTEHASCAFCVTHQKTFLFDGSVQGSRSAIVMSFNLVTNYLDGGTRDFGVVTTDDAEVGEIESVFQSDWSGGSFSPSAPSLVWSPSKTPITWCPGGPTPPCPNCPTPGQGNSRTKTTQLIEGAMQSLRIYNEEFTDTGILGVLKTQMTSHPNLTVQVILSDMEGETAGSYKNQTAYCALNGTQAGSALIMKSSSTSPYIHAKMILADYDSGAGTGQAFVGSENLAETSLDSNRELGILVGDPGILRDLDGQFQWDWANLPPVPAIVCPPP